MAARIGSGVARQTRADQSLRRGKEVARDLDRFFHVPGFAGSRPGSAVANIGRSPGQQRSTVSVGGRRWPFERGESRRAGAQLQRVWRAGFAGRRKLQQPVLAARSAQLDGHDF